MRNNITLGIIFIIMAILQNSIINIFTLWGVSVNLPLCFFMMIIFLSSKEKNLLIYGILTGLYFDITVGLGFGIKALSYFIVGIAVFLLKEFLNEESKLSVIICSTISTILYHTTTYFLSMVLYGQYSFARFFLTLLPLILLNDVISLIIYLILRKIYGRRPKMSRYERYEII